MRRPGLGVAVVVALLCESCATHTTFDRYLRADLYEEAARAFQRDSTVWNDPKALLLAGRMFANPALPVYDRAQARRTLERLVTAFPHTSEARAVGVLLPLLERMEKVDDELTALTSELAGRMTQLDTMAASRTAAEGEIQALRRRVQRVEADLEEALKELERLKAIDLRRRPGDRRQ